jgi:hypothetical protein
MGSYFIIGRVSVWGDERLWRWMDIAVAQTSQKPAVLFTSYGASQTDNVLNVMELRT